MICKYQNKSQFIIWKIKKRRDQKRYNNRVIINKKNYENKSNCIYNKEEKIIYENEWTIYYLNIISNLS